MAQDIRELFKNDKSIAREGMRPGHQERFKALLDKELPVTEEKQQNQIYLWMKIAAVLIIVVTVGGLLYTGSLGEEVPATTEATALVASEKSEVQLSDISPDFKKLEDYYLASINVELAQLEIDDENKELVDSFLVALDELNMEYKSLNADLTEVGVNEQTVAALINNLQLRLDLLYKLKSKLKELKENRLNELNTQTL